MSDIIDSITQVWREIAHISEWSGISVGVLLALAALAYLDPDVRKFAIRTGIAVILGYCVLMYGYATGTSDRGAECDAAKKKDDLAAVTRDKANAAKLAADNPPPSAAEQKQDEANEQNALKALAGAVSCPLGADALRLRQ